MPRTVFGPLLLACGRSSERYRNSYPGVLTRGEAITGRRV